MIVIIAALGLQVAPDDLPMCFHPGHIRSIRQAEKRAVWFTLGSPMPMSSSIQQ